MLRTASAYIPRYGLYYKTLEKYCTPCKPVSRIANPGPNRIDTAQKKRINHMILLGINNRGPYQINQYKPRIDANLLYRPRSRNYQLNHTVYGAGG